MWYSSLMCLAWSESSSRRAPKSMQLKPHKSATLDISAASTPWDSSFPAASIWIHLVVSTKLQVVLDSKNIQRLWRKLWRTARCES